MIKKILVFIGLFILILIIWEAYNSIYKINPAIKESGKEVKTTINKKVAGQVKDKDQDIFYTEPDFKNLSEVKPKTPDATLQETDTALSPISNDIEEIDIPTPDELYAQQISSTADTILKKNELPSTLPDIEVIPAGLREIERVALQDASEYNEDSMYEEALPDDPSQAFVSGNLVIQPASEDYEPVISSELQLLEQSYDAGLLEEELAVTIDILYDDPDTREISELDDDPPIESKRNVGIE